MDCFPADVRQVLVERGCEADAAEIETYHTRVLQRRVARIEVASADWSGPLLATIANATVLQQVLLRRAERLTVSCGTVAADHNEYGLALLVRGHVETTALMGYACSRTASVSKSTGEAEAYGEIVKSLLFGTRFEDVPALPRAVNMMTCIDKADKYMSVDPRYSGKKVIRQLYDFLSEHAHPNMSSHNVAIEYESGFVKLQDLTQDDELCVACFGAVKLSLMLLIDFYDDMVLHLARLRDTPARQS